MVLNAAKVALGIDQVQSRMLRGVLSARSRLVPYFTAPWQLTSQAQLCGELFCCETSSFAVT